MLRRNLDSRDEVTLRGDFPWARPHWEDVAGALQQPALSPTGKRAVFEARGEIFTVPAEKGDVRNLTRTPGAHEREADWSPDGARVAFLSDRTGEEEHDEGPESVVEQAVPPALSRPPVAAVFSSRDYGLPFAPGVSEITSVSGGAAFV